MPFIYINKLKKEVITDHLIAFKAMSQAKENKAAEAI